MGYELGLRNGAQGGGVAWVSEGLVGLQTSECQLITAPFATTQQWNTYRLEVDALDVVLLINGLEILRAPNWPNFPYQAGYIFFGDGTDLGASESALRNLEYGPFGGISANKVVLPFNLDAHLEMKIEPGRVYADAPYQLIYTPALNSVGMPHQISEVPVWTGWLDSAGTASIETRFPSEMLAGYIGLKLSFHARIFDSLTGALLEQTRQFVFTIT